MLKLLNEYLPRPAFLHKKIAAGWLYFAIVITLLQFAYSYKPRLSVEPDILVNPRNPTAVLFRVTNTGPLHVDDVSFECKIQDGPAQLDTSGNVTLFGSQPSLIGQGEVETLASGQTVTRDCSAGPFQMAIINPAALRIDIIAHFHWPWVFLSGSSHRHFSTRMIDANRYALVPDVEPFLPLKRQITTPRPGPLAGQQ